MIWDYEIGYYKYQSKETPIIDCINYYPINDFIHEYLLKQDFIKLESEDNKPKIIDGKIIALI